jgi:hypothetical protein
MSFSLREREYFVDLFPDLKSLCHKQRWAILNSNAKDAKLFAKERREGLPLRPFANASAHFAFRKVDSLTA